MGFFKKKKKEPSPVVEIIAEQQPCQHKWKDFNWYLKSAYWYPNGEKKSGLIFEYQVIEPYVCALCNERKNVVLDSNRWEHCSRKEVDDMISDLYKSLPQLRHKALVENDIHDFTMVDRAYLQVLDALTNPDSDVVPKIKA